MTGQRSGEPDKIYASSFSYTSHGAVGAMQLGNGLWEHSTFNERMQPILMALGTSSMDSSKLQLNYDHGAGNNGNILTQRIQVAGSPALDVTQTYVYDELNRIGMVTEGNPTTDCLVGDNSKVCQEYQYDRWGNRAVTAGFVQTPALTPQALTDFEPATNQLKNSIYDSLGNLTSDATSRDFTYDAENRQATYNGGLGAVLYSYDGEGQRVKKLEGGVTTVYVYDAFGRLIGDYTTPSSIPTGATSYLMADHLGSTRVVTDNGGNVTARKDYLPFGEEIPSTLGTRNSVQGYGIVDNIRQRFTQKERDTESGLDYFGARYHSGAQGRFTSPDPKIPSVRQLVNPQKWNKYAYTLNNPLRYFDPDGLEELDVQLRAFIPQRTVTDPLGRTFAGDTRGFSSAANASFRTSISVRIETDPSIRPGNPIISVTQPGVAGPTRLLDANGKLVDTKIATTGLPMVAGTRDANGNAVLNFQQNTKNPFEPQSLPLGIKANLDVTVTQNGLSVLTTGTLSGTPSFELNVGSTNVPLQTASSSAVGFDLGLFQTNPIQNLAPLPLPPPPPLPCAFDKEKPCQ